MKTGDNDKKLDGLIRGAIGRDGLSFDFGKWKRAHQRQVDAFQSEASGGQAPRASTSGVGYRVLAARLSKLAAAAAVFLLATVGVIELGGALGRANVAWADVRRQFQTVPFFSAEIYTKYRATDEPTQIELWMNQDRRIRVRMGKQVIFGREGTVSEAFDIESRQAVEPEGRAAALIEKIGQTGELSLDVIVREVFGGQAQEVTPLVNPNAVVSQDVVVFDVTRPDTSEWVRIWALRESRLPMRIRSWDPTDGGMTDAVFEYSKEQPEEFFDPNAFRSLLQKSGTPAGRTNIAYAFLQDPGGKSITPAEMFARSGYHVPQVEQAGITADGAVWIIAARGSNRMPNGYKFFGFSRLQDDLGRQYHQVYSAHRVDGDRSMDAFVPADYPFDRRVPHRLTLVCETADYHPRVPREVIGTVELTDWKRGQSWPAGTIQAEEWSFRTQMARKHCGAKQYDKVERILATLAGQPEDSAAALGREQVRLRLLLQQDQFDAAVLLSKRLLPILEDNYVQPHGFMPSPYVFRDVLEALVLAGRLEEAKQTWQHLKSLQPELRPGLNPSARQSIAESIRREFDNCLRTMIPDLSRRAHLTVEQLGDIFQVPIKGNELFEGYTFWDWNPEFDKPKYRNWERHLAELAEHYRTHPLPESIEILPHTQKEEYGARQTAMPGIPGYSVTPLAGTLRTYARFYHAPESVGRVRVQEDVPDVVLDHDLVVKNGTANAQVELYVLSYFGLEVVEVNEPRRVWIARYDGRKLKDYREVCAPVPFDPTAAVRTGMMAASSSGGWDLPFLLNQFTYWQNIDGQAAGVLILDQTGLKERVSRESPQWDGPGALEPARRWFQDQFGVTFTEETRTRTTYVVRTRK
jgi:hypothetical protein